MQNENNFFEYYSNQWPIVETVPRDATTSAHRGPFVESHSGSDRPVVEPAFRPARPAAGRAGMKTQVFSDHLARA